MHGGRQPQKPASVMLQDQKTIQKPGRNRRHHGWQTLAASPVAQPIDLAA
jgi:hypothetical protein